MRFAALAPLLLALPIALSAASCGRSTLGSLTTAEEGGGGAGGGTTTSSTTTTTTTSTTTTAPGECGNGIVQDPEQCDDGNTSNSDACLSNCTLAFCGDGIVHVGFEQCDDANQSSNDDCVSCAVAFCGDGFLHAGFEECDDGNFDDNDSCNNLCKLTSGTCGNGVIDPGEECDDGNASNTDQCLNGCFKAFCGDAFVMTGVEECDDGNGANGDNCLPTCKSAKCGDGVVHVGVEPCDDGNPSNTDACLTTCQKASCGDGFVQAGVEQCDDGNADNTDACTNMCTLNNAICGNGVLDPGEACDDGNADNTDACLKTCQKAACGDGFVQTGVEACDDGNNVSTDACVAGCKVAKCGDGFVQAGVEACDDGNLANGDGCSSTCQLPVCGDGTVDPGEACDLGAMNADRPAFLLTFQNQSQGAKPIVSPADASLFYNYFSASGHTGFEILDGSILFLYADSTTKALSLFVEHGIDFTTTGLSQASGHITMDITGLPASAVVALSDDTPSEFFKLSATSVHGDWSFQQNTDGGVVSGLPFPGSWTLNITPTLPANFKWQFEDGGSMPTPVVMGGPSAQIQAFDTPSACRKSCTVPKCGDGVLDGGEVCDDGNVASGDGCAADCKAF